MAFECVFGGLRLYRAKWIIAKSFVCGDLRNHNDYYWAMGLGGIGSGNRRVGGGRVEERGTAGNSVERK